MGFNDFATPSNEMEAQVTSLGSVSSFNDNGLQTEDNIESNTQEDNLTQEPQTQNEIQNDEYSKSNQNNYNEQNDDIAQSDNNNQTNETGLQSYDDVWNNDGITLDDIVNNNNVSDENQNQDDESDEEDDDENTENNEIDENVNDTLEELEEKIFGKKQNQEQENIATKNYDDEEKQYFPQRVGVAITRPLKYRGKEIWVKSEEEAIELMQKGLDYSFKMSKIKPYRAIVDIIENNGLSEEDIVALADAKNGNKNALKYLMNKFGINESNDFDFDGSFDNEQNEQYRPNVQKKSPIIEIYEEINTKDPELAGKVAKVFDSLDDSFKVELNEPRAFMAFVQSVASGEFEQVMPEAIKIKAINPALSWIEAYQYAFNNLQNQRRTINKKSKPKPKNTTRKQQVGSKKTKKTIKEKYDELWSDKYSLQDLEKMIFK